jgi:hypothetical protein
MKRLVKRAHHALDMTNHNPSNLMRRATRSDSTAKRPLPPAAARRAFDPIAYAAALEVLG